MFFSFFKLRKCRTVLKNSLKLYRKKKQNLSSLEVYEIQEVMEKLQGAILSRNASLASNYRQKLEKIIRKYFKK